MHRTSLNPMLVIVALFAILAPTRADNLADWVEHLMDQEEVEPDERAEIRRFIDFLQEEVPEGYELLAKRLREDAEEARDLLEELHAQSREYFDLREDAPDQAALELEAARAELRTILLGDEVRALKLAAETGEKQAADKLTAKEDELKAELANLFDRRMRRERNEQKQMEAELRELRQLLEKREKHRERIIETRYFELIGEGEAVHW